MTDRLHRRGERIYEACVTWFGLGPGESANLKVDGDRAGEAVVFTDDTVILNGLDAVALAQYLGYLRAQGLLRPVPHGRGRGPVPE